MGDAPSRWRGGGRRGGFALEGLYLTRRLAKDYTDEGRTVYGPAVADVGRETGTGTGAWRGGPDPLAPPYDVARPRWTGWARIVLAGGSLRDAPARPASGRGPDSPARVSWPGRPLAAQGPPDAPGRAAPGQTWTARVTRAAGALLDQALGRRAGREAGPAGHRGGPGFAETHAGRAAPLKPPARVEELTGYNWASDEARQTYQQILEGLRRDVLEQRFAGMA